LHFFFFVAGITLILRTTFAANINLNSGSPVEFGQGVAQSTACDNSILVTPFSSFVNASGGGGFKFTSIKVTDISDNCNGKIFTIKAYSKNETSPLVLYTTNGTTDYNEIKIISDGNRYSLLDSGLLSDDITSLSGGFTINFSTAGPPPSVARSNASDVNRITIETSGIGQIFSTIVTKSISSPVEVIPSSAFGSGLNWKTYQFTSEDENLYNSNSENQFKLDNS
jgi:hypothetical protein